MSETKSVQGNRVQLELEQLRSKHLAKNQRDRLKDLCSPLTTPEEAQAFLASMRDKSHQRFNFQHQQPPSNLTADGMDAWYHKQKERERELRQRRHEAEQLLRGYRGRPSDYSARSRGGGSAQKELGHLSVVTVSRGGGLLSPADPGLLLGTTPLSAVSALSETLDDPHDNIHHHSHEEEEEDEEEDEDAHAHHGLPEQQQPHETLAAAVPPMHTETSLLVDHEEKKLDDQQEAQRSAESESGGGSSGYQNPSTSAEEEEEPVVHVKTTTTTILEKPLTIWRDFVSSEPGAKFPPEAGRYHLYLSYACPGSHRVLIVRALKGLDDIISVTYVHPTWRLTNPDDPADKHRGWVFGNPGGRPFANTIGRGGPFPAAYADNEPDPLFDAFSMRDIYLQAADTSGKYTIPVLYDKELNTIVNNESSDIAYMLNSCFNDFAADPDLDLYTEGDQDGVEKLNEVSDWMAPLMIHGVYRCGFAKTQRAYDKAIVELCVAFDRADDLLQRQRYLTGDTLTDVDIRLFATLIRFDEIYAFYFRANARLVMLTPSLLNFCRELYQIPGVAATCNMEQMKAHFYGSHAEWNKYSVIPRGLGFMELLELPHNRDELFLGSHEAEV